MATRRRRDHALPRHERQHRVRLPRRRPVDPARNLQGCSGSQRSHRSAGGVPRSHGIRSTIHRRRTGRAHRRGHLSDRRPRRSCPSGRFGGQLRQTARRPVQRDRAPPRAGPRGGGGDPLVQHLTPCSRASRIGVPRRGRERGVDRGDRGIRRPRVHTRGHPGVATRTGCCAARPGCGGPARVAHGHRGVVTAIDGTDVRVDAQSVCIHGDSPDATAMAVAVRALLDAENIDILPFVQDDGA